MYDVCHIDIARMFESVRGTCAPGTQVPTAEEDAAQKAHLGRRNKIKSKLIVIAKSRPTIYICAFSLFLFTWSICVCAPKIHPDSLDVPHIFAL